MIIGTKIEFENLADFILRDYLGNKYDSYIPFDVQAFAEDYLKLEISYTKFEQEQNIEGLRTGKGNLGYISSNSSNKKMFTQ